MRYSLVEGLIYTEDGQILDALPEGDHNEIDFAELVSLQHEHLHQLLEPATLPESGWERIDGGRVIVLFHAQNGSYIIGQSAQGSEVIVETYDEKYPASKRFYIWDMNLASVWDYLKNDSEPEEKSE